MKFSPLLLIIAHVLLLAMTPSAALAAEAAIPITEKGISISLSVYVTSLIFVAGSTWIVARYYHGQASKIEMLERKLEKIAQNQK